MPVPVSSRNDNGHGQVRSGYLRAGTFIMFISVFFDRQRCLPDRAYLPSRTPYLRLDLYTLVPCPSPLPSCAHSPSEMVFLSVLFFLHWLFIVVGAQDFNIPSSWRSHTSSLSRNERIDIALKALDNVVPLFNASTGQIHALEYQQSINILNYLQEISAYQCEITESDVSPTMTWALAAIYAHRTYGDQSLLNDSMEVWEQQNQFVVPAQTGAINKVPGTNFSLAKTCNKATTSGAVMNVNSTDSFCHASTVGGFITLSAVLFELTDDPKYAAAVEQSAQFMQSHMFNKTIIIDRVDIHGCGKVADEAVTYNTGHFIEGLSVYANHSERTHKMWAPLLDEVITKAIHFSGWTGPDGVNFEFEREETHKNAHVGERSLFIRGLFEARSHMDPDSPAARLIESYITIQYNALLELASNRSNLYSPMWHGPPVRDVSPQGQLAAIDTLNSAAGFVAPILLLPNKTQSTFPTSFSPSMVASNYTSESQLPNHNSSGSGFSQIKIILIASGVGILGSLLLIVIVFLLFRCRNHKLSRTRSLEAGSSAQSPSMLHRETLAISRTPTATLPAFDASIYQWKTSESQIYQEADISSVFGERGSVVSQPNDIAVHSLHNTVTLNDADSKPTPRALVRQFRARNSLENMDNPPPYRF